ncbi:MAG TPA: flagellar hook-associated protein FlgK [Xanthobacteraceae bacterium]|nr:flagellar hook-associated protein FlgK [Xanthobacteraceae bacterium]
MSLVQALNTALAGLQVTQSGLSVVAGNVANVQTPDYVRKALVQAQTAAGDTISVRVAAINRELDELLLTQWRTETSGGAYADTIDRLYQQLQFVYGAPGASNGLDAMFNDFTAALQGLIASPNSAAAQNTVISAARLLAQQLNAMSAGIQTLRTAAEQSIAAGVAAANDALQLIAQINAQISTMQPGTAEVATLLDRRDAYINQLAQLMNVKVVKGDNNQVSVYTSNGIQLVGASAMQLSFDAHGTLTPDATWNIDPNLRGVGTITLTAPGGGNSIDLIAAGAFASGEIGAYLQMRDRLLPQAQTQLDEFAARMAQAVSDLTVAGTAVTAGPQSGFEVDVGALRSGNTVQLTYTDAGSVAHKITIVRVDDPAALPLADTVTADPNDQVIGVDFSGGMASVVAQLTAALGATGLDFSNPTGTVLRVLNDPGGTISVDTLSATQTVTSLASGNVQLPLFMDGTNVYSGAIAANGSQLTGFAARIGVNSALIANPANLIVFQNSPLTPAGDPTRPLFLYDRLANAAFTFSPTAGIGGTTAPFSGSLSSYIGQIMTVQGQAAANASSLKQGQEIVVNALQQRLNQQSGVNIDQEMVTLLNLQSAYSANARVLNAVKEMFEMLLSM